jgi:hypothetical protein
MGRTSISETKAGTVPTAIAEIGDTPALRVVISYLSIFRCGDRVSNAKGLRRKCTVCVHSNAGAFPRSMAAAD